MDREIFNEFYKNRKELKKSADKITKDLNLNALEDSFKQWLVESKVKTSPKEDAKLFGKFDKKL